MTSDATINQPSLKELVASLTLRTHIPERHAARNALYHIEKAWEIKAIDPSMAALRAITGVEEAVTAIFHTLKRHKYKNAKSLNKDRHFHKAAAPPFLRAVAGVLSSLEIKTQIHLDQKQKNPKFMIAVAFPGVEGIFYPEPPLHYEVLADSTPYDFAAEIEKIVTAQNAKTFCDYSNHLAGERNRILYASDKGIPVASVTDDHLLKRETLIVNLLVIFLLIAQYEERQLFVQQVLNAYVKSLHLIKEEGIKCTT